jgi:hypothetical protein
MHSSFSQEVHDAGLDRSQQRQEEERHRSNTSLASAVRDLRVKNHKSYAMISPGNTGLCHDGGQDNHPRVQVPILPCFLKVLGPKPANLTTDDILESTETMTENGSLYSYFLMHALYGFQLLRKHPEYLLQILKSSLLSIPQFSLNHVASQEVCEQLMMNLMLELSPEDAHRRFLKHLQIDISSFSATRSPSVYPAPLNAVDA